MTAVQVVQYWTQETNRLILFRPLARAHLPNCLENICGVGYIFIYIVTYIY